MTCSQLVHELKQSIRGFSAPLSNLRDDWSWPLRWVSYGKCTSIYGYTLDMTYYELWFKAIK